MLQLRGRLLFLGLLLLLDMAFLVGLLVSIGLLLSGNHKLLKQLVFKPAFRRVLSVDHPETIIC